MSPFRGEDDREVEPMPFSFDRDEDLISGVPCLHMREKIIGIFHNCPANCDDEIGVTAIDPLGFRHERPLPASLSNYLEPSHSGMFRRAIRHE